MPMVHSIISEADTHVYLPVLKQVAHHLVNALNVQQYIENYIYIETGWTSVKSTRVNHTFFTRTDGLHLVAEQMPYNNPVFDTQSFLYSTGHGFQPWTLDINHFQLFHDEIAEISLHETCLPTSFTINCNFWFQNRNIAYETIKKMMIRFASGEIYNLSIAYDYPIPKDIVNAMIELYKYRKFDGVDNIFGPTFKETGKVTFANWIDKASQASFVTNMSRNGKHKELCITKTINNALISIEYDSSKPVEDKQGAIPSRYAVPFTVKIQFEEPSAVVIKYPCIVDSAVLDDSLIPAVRKNESPIASMPWTLPTPNMQAAYWAHAAVRDPATGEVVCPFYDDWQLPWDQLIHRSYRPFFRTLYTPEEDGKQLVLDLKDALTEDGMKLDPIVLEVLAAQLNDSFRLDCIFNISSYVRSNRQMATSMSLDKDLILRVNVKDLHPQRHLILSEITDLKYLNPKWYEWFKKYPWYFQGNDQFPGYDPSNNTGDKDATYRSKRIFRYNLVPRYPSQRNGQAGPTE